MTRLMLHLAHPDSGFPCVTNTGGLNIFVDIPNREWHQFWEQDVVALGHDVFYGCGLQVGIVWNGIESIRKLEKLGAPILIVLSGALLAWAYIQARGFGPMLSLPSQFIPGGPKEGQFWQVFFPALTANVGFWATLSLNIPGEANRAHLLYILCSVWIFF